MALSKEEKRNLIKLQNALFDTNEHELMVTPAFLDECVKKYMIKHLRAINTCMSNIKVTKNPALFYSSIPPLIEHLDALIKIEKYYEMARPNPSAFKKDFEDNRTIYATNMIKRYVHETKQHVPAPNTIKSPIVKRYYQDAFNTLMNFETEMNAEEKSMVDVFYSGLFKRNYADPIPADEYAPYIQEEGDESVAEGAESTREPSEEEFTESPTGAAIGALESFGKLPGGIPPLN
jgi:hypothetical protein